ncbi:hypothetical protein, partial [Adlercreutzia sp.]|uniref:hypothetical protein n=1 Tax=Adlercreutzia sp. TaxID=1872387 RepID=UPI003A8FFC90
MYDRDVVELALLALEEGMSQQEAAELCGASRGTVGYWARGRLPHGRRAPSARPPRRRARMAPPDAKEEPLNEAERAAYEAAMTENQLLRAVLDDLKGAGSHPGSMSNRRKCELGVSATAKSAERATLSRRRRPRFPAGGATALWPPALPRAAAQGALDRGV